MNGPFVPWTTKQGSPGWIIEACGCHLWTGATNGRGYPRVRIRGRSHYVHRLRYEREIGPIPHGLELDHLCGTPGCCNPRHLEPVTHAENLRRGTGWAATKAAQTHCKRGHPLSGPNLLPGDGRRCRTCKNAKERERRATKVGTIERWAALADQILHPSPEKSRDGQGSA